MTDAAAKTPLPQPVADLVAQFTSNLPSRTPADVEGLAYDILTAMDKMVDQAVDQKAASMPILGPAAAAVIKAGIDQAFNQTRAEVDAYADKFLTGGAS